MKNSNNNNGIFYKYDIGVYFRVCCMLLHCTHTYSTHLYKTLVIYQTVRCSVLMLLICAYEIRCTGNCVYVTLNQVLGTFYEHALSICLFPVKCNLQHLEMTTTSATTTVSHVYIACVFIVSLCKLLTCV